MPRYRASTRRPPGCALEDGADRARDGGFLDLDGYRAEHRVHRSEGSGRDRAAGPTPSGASA